MSEPLSRDALFRVRNRRVPLAAEPARDIAAAVMVAPDGRYLLQRRDDFPWINLPDHWCLFGGNLEAGEAPEEGLRRELVEELSWAAGSMTLLSTQIIDVEPEVPRWRLHFFTVPFGLAELDAMQQREGAGKGLMTADEACRLERIAPWDLCALLLHARRSALFPPKRSPPPDPGA